MMNEIFDEESYDRMISDLFCRFPSFQKEGATAYKPGMDNMFFFDQLAGHPHRKYRTIHVAGTNGKGSVSNMLASLCSKAGLRTGLYTSPHLLDFRERIRVRDESGTRMIGKKEVVDFVHRWNGTFDHLGMSFFEITTMMAFDWFAEQKVDVAVIETGLGGRLDSTNIIEPVMDVITGIGLDHCDMLGSSLAEIAYEKAGIIKPGTPVVVWERNEETGPVFENKVLYTNLPLPEFAGDRSRIMSLLVYADAAEPAMWDMHREILDNMDLKGEYQVRNLRTALTAWETLNKSCGIPALDGNDASDAIVNTASRMDFHGRWEKLSEDPYVICDIGHNADGLRWNFAQLEHMMSTGKFSPLTMVYGTVADKDYESIFPIMPENASYVFTNAEGKRALPAGELAEKYIRYCRDSGRIPGDVHVVPDVRSAVEKALEIAASSRDGNACGSSMVLPLIYIGGSTYVVSEAMPLFA